MLLGGEHAGPVEPAHFRAGPEKIVRLQHPYIVRVFEVNKRNVLLAKAKSIARAKAQRFAASKCSR
jgi:hypothetical protein